jgi:hypothetical protein
VKADSCDYWGPVVYTVCPRVQYSVPIIGESGSCE